MADLALDPFAVLGHQFTQIVSSRLHLLSLTLHRNLDDMSLVVRNRLPVPLLFDHLLFFKQSPIPLTLEHPLLHLAPVLAFHGLLLEVELALLGRHFLLLCLRYFLLTFVQIV